MEELCHATDENHGDCGRVGADVLCRDSNGRLRVRCPLATRHNKLRLRSSQQRLYHWRLHRNGVLRVWIELLPVRLLRCSQDDMHCEGRERWQREQWHGRV